MEAVLDCDENLDNVNSPNGISDSKHSPKSEILQTIKESNRIKKRRDELLQRIRSLPESNEAATDIDFDTEIRAIRSLFLQCSLPEKFILDEFKSLNSQPTSEW